ncbi:MAG: lysostaphin resistance A-like protein [Bacteroidales bacterium]
MLLKNIVTTVAYIATTVLLYFVLRVLVIELFYKQELYSNMLIESFLSCLLVILTAFLLQRFILKESFREIGFREFSARSVVRALFTAVFVSGASFLVYLLTKKSSAEKATWQWDDWCAYFGIAIFLSIASEVMFRGIVQRILSKSMGKWVAWILASLAFSLTFTYGCKFSVQLFTNFLLMGLLLGGTYMYTNNLVYPIFLHLFMNLFHGGMMGISLLRRDATLQFLKMPDSYLSSMMQEWSDLQGSYVYGFFFLIAIIVDVGYRHHVARHYK